MTMRHKDSGQENFPVGLLIDKKLQPLVKDYYNFARFGDDIADNPALSGEEKTFQLNQLEKAFLGDESQPSLAFATALGKSFQEQNLSSSLALDLLKAFRLDSRDYSYQYWSQLINYCTYSAVPVGRFMLAIHDENPTTYLPAASLCAALQIVNHLQDIKYDYLSMKRIYIPQEFLNQFDVSKEDLGKDVCTEGLKQIISLMLGEVRGLLKDAKILLSVVKDKRLKTELGVILSLTNSMIKRIDKYDVLAQDIKLSKWDWFKAIVEGSLKTLFIRRKTLNVKDI